MTWKPFRDAELSEASKNLLMPETDEEFPHAMLTNLVNRLAFGIHSNKGLALLNALDILTNVTDSADVTVLVNGAERPEMSEALRAMRAFFPNAFFEGIGRRS